MTPVHRVVDAPHTMSALREALGVVAAALPAGGRVALIGFPTHGNVGDHLILLGTLALFDALGIRVVAALPDVATDLAVLRRTPPDTVLCLHGGGSFGDLWPGLHADRLRVVGAMPDRRVVVLPQTVSFRDPRAVAASAAVLHRHEALHVFVRDRGSLGVAESMGLRASLAPDLSHQLWPLRTPGAPTRGPLVLLRDDREAGVVPPELRTGGPVHVDWSGVLGRRWRAEWTLRRIGARLGPSALRALPTWRRLAEAWVGRAAEVVAAHERLTTSRLHGLLLARLVGRPAWLLDDRYGKCFAYHDAWFGPDRAPAPTP